jgi:prevent-host-death family protein
MTVKVYSSDQARAKWRDVLDTAVAGQDIIIERYGKPTVAVIAYEDFAEFNEILQDLRDAREAQQILAEWRRDPGIARPWEEFEAELIAEGLLDE